MGDDTVLERATLGVPVTIRLCREADLPNLEWFGLYTPHREIILESFRQQQRGDGRMILADVNGFPAGQAWLDFARRRHLMRATIWAVRVFPPFRGNGLGTRLMLAAERIAQEQGYLEAGLGVDRDNAAVLPFYERLGYVACGNERGRYSYRTPDGSLMRVPIDQWLLRKPLAPARASAPARRVAL